MIESVSKVGIGCSAGGLDALMKFFEALPGDCSSSFLVVQHFPRNSISVLPEILAGRISLPVFGAEDGMPFQPGTVYVARPNTHLIVDSDTLFCRVGPRENRFRPSIDVTLRSLACEYQSRSVGILLTGMLNDGVSGLGSIQRCGGVTMVQDPQEAVAKDMPMAAIESLEVDHVAPLRKLATLVHEYSQRQAPDAGSVSKFDLLEHQRGTGIASLPWVNEEIGESSALSCPECGGPLWKLADPAVERYRCHVGHSFTDQYLELHQDEYIEDCLWKAYRTLKEKARMNQAFTRRYEKLGAVLSEKKSRQRMVNLEKKINLITNILEIDSDGPIKPEMMSSSQREADCQDKVDSETGGSSPAELSRT